MSTPIRVLLADDQSLVRVGFTMLLNAQDDMRVVGEAGDGAQAVAAVRADPGGIDVVLMDIRMPVLDGVQATQQICAPVTQLGTGSAGSGVGGRADPTGAPATAAGSNVVGAVGSWINAAGGSTDAAGGSSDPVADHSIDAGAGQHQAPKVLVLTTFDVDEYVYAALRAGASGFMLKDARPAELLAAIRAVAAGDAVVAPSATKRLLATFLPRLPSSTADDRLAVLTAREREVLERVATGLSNAEISAELFMAEATVKTHIGHLLAKLQVRDRVGLVVLAYEAGLVGG